MLRWRNFINRDDVINSIFFKNLGRGLIIALFALSTLSAVVYYDDAIAGNGGGGGGSKGGTSDSAKNESGPNTSPNPGYSRKPMRNGYRISSGNNQTTELWRI